MALLEARRTRRRSTLFLSGLMQVQVQADLVNPQRVANAVARRSQAGLLATRAIQNNPTTLPLSSMSMRLAAGSRGRPGIVMMSPQTQDDELGTGGQTHLADVQHVI